LDRVSWCPVRRCLLDSEIPSTSARRKHRDGPHARSHIVAPRAALTWGLPRLVPFTAVQVVQHYHSLDALRAAMMLLGIVLHTMASYTTLPLGDAWPFKDAQTSAHLNLPLFVIHIFRMPVFFAVAGFFAALLYERGRIRGLAINRAKRVLLPLIIFWLALAPLVAGGFLFALHQRTGTPVVDLVARGSKTTPVNTMHLWFLYYLVIFYAAAIVVSWLARGRGLSASTCAALTTSSWSPLLWMLVTAVTLLRMPHSSLDGSTLLVPPARTLIAYGVFFVFGWLLFRGRERMDRLAGRSWPLLGAGVVGVAAFIYLQIAPPSPEAQVLHAINSVVMAGCIWSFVLGIAGVFILHVTRDRPIVTYLSRAAYWVYLVHLPIVIVVAGALARAPLHAFVKAAVVLSVTTAASLGTYHYMVRSTFIGLLLNGSRHSKSRAHAPVAGAGL
jgi:glucan biosynthesis protein C